MKHSTTKLIVTVGLGIGLSILVLWLPARQIVRAGTPITVCLAGGCDYTTIQAAVDAAGDGDIIKIAAGHYTQRNTYDGLAQVVYLNKTVTLRGGYTTTNWAVSDPAAYPTILDAQGQGRVIYITGNISPTLQGLFITGGNPAGLRGNPADNDDAGGGVYVVTAQATLIHNRIFSNTASLGGGVFLANDHSSLKDNYVANNTAGEGAGLYLYHSDANLTGNTIVTNTALPSNFGAGGGLYLNISQATLTGNIISANATNWHGGGLYLASSAAKLTNNLISANRVDFNGGGVRLQNSTAILTGNTIISNSAGYEGGGVELDSSPATLTGNIIVSNTSSSNGGGLYAERSQAIFDRNTINSNTSKGSGGGISLVQSDDILANNIIADNRALIRGSGLYLVASSPHLWHTTIAGNTGGDGSGILIDQGGNPSTVALTNTILVSHTVGITVARGNTVKLEATLWGSGPWANHTDWQGEGVIITGAHNIWADPGFTCTHDPCGSPYHLSPTSAAVDAGVKTDLTADIDGEARPTAFGADLGADELPGASLRLDQSASALLLMPGQIVTYTLFVTAEGTRVATDLWLTDTLPALQQTIGITTDRGQCVVRPGWGSNVVCNLGVMTPGASARLYLTTRVTTTLPADTTGAMRHTVQIRSVEAGATSSLETRLQSCRVRLNSSSVDYPTIQAAVDASTQPTDVLKLAGYCSGVSARAGITQTVYLSKTLTIQGGWNLAFTQRNVVSYPTTLDAQGQGRVLYIAGPVSPTITGLRLTGGNATGLGGFVDPQSSDSGDAGGGVYVLTASVVFRDNEVFNNSAGRGGGVYLAYSDAQLTANTVSSNSAAFKGGGIYLLESDRAELDHNTVSGNTADAAGGGIFLGYSDARLNGNLISANTTQQNGGGLGLAVSQARLTDNTIADNLASGRGGGVHLLQSDATIRGNHVVSNTADEGGGFYLAESPTTLADNTIEANTALASGGGLYLDTSDALLDKNAVQANSAKRSGGGACLNWSEARLDANLFNRNQATFGGGILVGGGAPAFESTTIRANTAQDGGGLYLLYGEPAFSNTLVTDNRAENGGSGLWIEGATPRLVHTTIARNYGGDGSGVYVTSHYDSKSMYYSYVEMTNTILVSHSLGITVTSGNEVKLENTLWGAGEWANGTDWGVGESPAGTRRDEGVVITGGHNLWTAPGFTCIDAACARPYHLAPNSPARDVASNVGVKEDVDGQQRPMGQGYDLGADEAAGPGLDLSQQLSDRFLNPGQSLTSTFIITSVGSSQAAHTVLTVTLNAWQRVKGVVSSIGNCTVAAAGGVDTVACGLGTMPPGQKAVVTLTATVSDTVRPGQAMAHTTAVAADGAGNIIQTLTYGQDCHVRLNEAVAEYTTVQAAVDAAQSGDWVKVAGFCAGANERNGISAQVHLDKNLTLQGGYTRTHWLAPDPARQPTTLDALGLGGVLSVSGGITPTIDGFHITGGRATYGGGINLAYNSAATLRRNNIIANTADYGGGVAMNWSQAWLVNNVIAANRANTTGAGLYIIDSKVDMRQTTIAQNTGGDGSGLHIGYGPTWGLRGSDVTMKNTILVSHTVGITLDVGHKMPAMEATLWGSDPMANRIEGGNGDDNTLGTLNRQGDPAFVAPERGDYHLARTSAARDAGVDAGIKEDGDGRPRPVGAGYDLGAFEYPGSGLDMTQWSSAGSANPGQTFTYTTLITSVGDIDAVGVVLTYTLDPLQPAVAAATSVGECAIAAGEVTCPLGTLVSGQTVAATLTVQAAATLKVRQVMTLTTAVAGLDAAQQMQTSTYGQNCHVRLDSSRNFGAEYPNIQAAVDAARPGNRIKVAGICVGARERHGTRQQVYLDKAVALQGGYSPDQWTAPDPVNHPTTLDALGQGRVFYITGGQSPRSAVSPTVTGLRITGGGAVEMGGGVYIISATAVVSDNQVFGNRATNGGGIYLDNSGATLRGNTIFSNTADYGGGIYGDHSQATLTGNQVMSNTADGGGGIKLQDSPATLTENKIISNTAKVYGGGLDLWASDATFNRNTIADNAAVGSVASYGGGIHSFDSKLTLTENLVISNTAGEGGGGLGLHGSQATLTGNTISTNTAVLGGGVMLDESEAVLERNLIAANAVAYEGGGLRVYESKAALTHNIITANRAGAAGGGLALTFGMATVNGNTLSFNSSDRGGGMSLDYQSTARITNTIIADNQSRSGGSALHLTLSSASLVHATVAHNTGGDGSGISVDKCAEGVSSVAITDTILAGYTIGLKVTKGCTATLEAILWEYDRAANQKDEDGLGTVVNGPISIQGDPGFICTGDACVTPYRLGPVSAARDAGMDAGVTIDIDGDPRPQGGGYDIGADEAEQP